MKERLVKRFLEYVMTETTSDPKSNKTPSTECQWDLAKKLKKELEDLGFSDVKLSDMAVVTAKVPATTDRKIPKIGFVAHMDTAPDASGKDVNPIIYEDYDGEDIVLNPEKNIIMKVEDFPELKNYKGHDLIVTDGNTLLGADDKAGIAEIMTAMEYFLEHNEIEHGEIGIAFTPDEEIGGGAKDLDLEKFGCDFAYTIDGGPLGELEFENFNAAKAVIKIKGRSVHPGSAKNKMVNSIVIAMEILSLLPANERPETTEGYEGFYHASDISGNISETRLEIIIRDHDRELFEAKKNWIKNVIALLNIKYSNAISAEFSDTYYNMKEMLKPHPEIKALVLRAMEEIGVAPKVKPVRGGTDGAQLSFRGLPCPNIFTGGMNYHGIYEYVSINDMMKSVELIQKIVVLAAE